ncbi:MAG TPA: hypothetical protein VFA18_01295 [Gemmataceae bacterium]|nr:hypothetical protein [Gemmataceae bacterium]
MAMQGLFTNEMLAKAREQEAKLAERVASDKCGILLDGHYGISWRRINTPGKIVAWVHHLAGKGWVTAGMLARVMELAGRYHGIDVDEPC